MPARRKSRSPRRSKSPRSRWSKVLKRRSSGKARRAAVTRRSPKRRTYKGTDTRLYGMQSGKALEVAERELASLKEQLASAEAAERSQNPVETLRWQISKKCEDWHIFRFDAPTEPVPILPLRPDQAMSLCIHLLTGQTRFYTRGRYDLEYGHVSQEPMVKMTRSDGELSFFCHPSVVPMVGELIAQGTKQVPFTAVKSPLIVDGERFRVIVTDGVPTVTPTTPVQSVPEPIKYTEKKWGMKTTRGDGTNPPMNYEDWVDVEYLKVMYTVNCDKRPDIGEGMCVLKFSTPTFAVATTVKEYGERGNQKQGDSGTVANIQEHTVTIAGKTFTVVNTLYKQEMEKQLSTNSYVSVHCKVEPSSAPLSIASSDSLLNPTHSVTSTVPFTLTVSGPPTITIATDFKTHVSNSEVPPKEWS